MAAYGSNQCIMVASKASETSGESETDETCEEYVPETDFSSDDTIDEPATHFRTKNTLCSGTSSNPAKQVPPLRELTNSKCLSKPIIIKCGDEEFIAPRGILCKASQKLNAMSQYISPNQEWEINMTNAPKDIMRTLLEYVTTHNPNVLNELAKGTMFSLISLAHGMEMAPVETELFALILKKCHSYSTIAYLWDLAQKYNNDAVVQEIIRYTQANINDMVAKGFFKAITWEQICVLMNRYGKDFPLDNLCHALIQWLKMDPAKKVHAPIVARQLDWKRLSNEVVCQLVFTEPVFRRILRHSLNSNVWCPPFIVKSALMQFKQSQLQNLVETGSSVSPAITQDCLNNKLFSYAAAWQRNLPVEQLMNTMKSLAFIKQPIKNPAFLVLGATRNNSMAMQVYFVESRAWAVPLDINLQLRCCFGAAYYRQNLYILGGDRGNGFVYERCFAYNVYNYQLKKIIDFRHPRCQCGVAVSGNELYVLGGLNEKQEAVSVVVKLSLADRYQMWKPIKNMKEKRYGPGIAVDPFGQVIVIGGHSCSCEFFNKQGWVEMESLPDSYRSYGMVAIYTNQLVYAFRDFNPSEVCVFDMIKNGLKIKPTIGPHPSRIASLCCYGSELWIITPKGRFYIFHLPTNSWKKTPLKSKELINYFYVAIIEQTDVRSFEEKIAKC